MKSYRAFLIGGGNHQNVQRTSHTCKRSAFGLSLYSWRLIALLISWMGVFYFQEFRQFDISRVSLSTIETVWSMKELICLLGSLGFSGAMLLLLYSLFPDHWRSLWHRQKLARMILENHWYEVKQTQSEGFFKDLNSSRTRETISYFPKIYYRMKEGLLSIRVQISLGKYQEHY